MEDINKRIQQQMLYHKNKAGENWLDFSHVIVPSESKEMNVICRYNQSYLQEANTPNDTHNLFYGASPP